MANIYDVGDLVRVTGTFTDADDAATDPDVVRVKYQDPSGNDTTDVYGVGSTVKSGTGVYYLDIDADEAGTWYYRVEGETSGGVGQGAAESYFNVRLSEF